MRSLRARLIWLWCLSLLASVVLGALLLVLYRQSAAAQVGRAQAVLAHACDLIGDRYGFYVSGWAGPADVDDAGLRRDLQAVVELALLHQEGVEGGIWTERAGSLAYAFPTYDGSGPKTDLPAAEAGPIGAINAAALRADRAVGRVVTARSQSLLLAACPLGGPVPDATAWAMTRVQTGGGLGPLQAGLSALLALLVVTSLLLWRTLLVWGRQVRGVATALGGVGGDGLAAVPRPGERELDRIVDALNLAGRRLGEARREAEALAERVARSERLAGLGRVAAGVAHEIRNPIAAARLQGENALAGDDARRRTAIGDMLGQLDRLDGLVSELLAMSQRVGVAPVRLGLRAFLEEVAGRHRERAAARSVTLAVEGQEGTARLDPVVVGRIMDNLLGNAVRHAAAGGGVVLSGRVAGGVLTVSVADDGEGVPAAMAERVFEPFVTGRADGTGLGLAIARELADAHGGRLLLRRGARGTLAEFALELPQ